MTRYFMKITKPMQIPAVVYETQARASKGQVLVFLEHCEDPNVVRGRSQPLEKPNMPEIKRPDGGLSWYHPGTYCVIRGAHGIKEPVAASQEAWGFLVRTSLSAFGYKFKDLIYRDSDIYISNGCEKHIVGLSGWRGNKVQVQRACWYERNPLPDIAHLLEADGIPPERFEAKLQTVHTGFFDMLRNELRAERIEIADFITAGSIDRAEELQKKKSGNLRGTCVMGRQNI